MSNSPRSYFTIVLKDGSLETVTKLADIVLHGVPGFALHRNIYRYGITHIETGASVFSHNLGRSPSPDAIAWLISKAHERSKSRENILRAIDQYKRENVRKNKKRDP